VVSAAAVAVDVAAALVRTPRPCADLRRRRRGSSRVLVVGGKLGQVKHEVATEAQRVAYGGLDLRSAAGGSRDDPRPDHVALVDVDRDDEYVAA
jgi:hypothetical protein